MSDHEHTPDAPCPFCGSAEMYHFDSRDSTVPNIQRMWVWCGSCQARAPRIVWNARVRPGSAEPGLLPAILREQGL